MAIKVAAQPAHCIYSAFLMHAPQALHDAQAQVRLPRIMHVVAWVNAVLVTPAVKFVFNLQVGQGFCIHDRFSFSIQLRVIARNGVELVLCPFPLACLLPHLRFLVRCISSGLCSELLYGWPLSVSGAIQFLRFLVHYRVSLYIRIIP